MFGRGRRAARAALPVAARRSTGTPSNGAQVVRVDYRLPAPQAVAMQRSIETLYGRGQAGALGQVRYGERASKRYAGDLGPHQLLRGAQGVGTSATIRPGFNRGLPSTSSVPGMPANAMLSALLADHAWAAGYTQGGE